MASPKKKVLIDRVDPALVAELERAVRATGALPLAKLPRAKLTKDALLELERLLLARGLERAPKHLRVPMDEQVLGLVQGGARIAARDLGKRVKGASKAELAAAVARATRDGQAHLVVRTQVEVLVGGGERVLDRAAMAELARLHLQLGKVLKKVKAKGPPRSLLREDLLALLEPLAPVVRPPEPAPARLAPSLLAAELARLEDPLLELVRIPELVRSLAATFAAAEVHRALLEAADAGTIELRPEAGGEFLDAGDARLCPPGPRGTLFSYARRRSS